VPRQEKDVALFQGVSAGGWDRGHAGNRDASVPEWCHLSGLCYTQIYMHL